MSILDNLLLDRDPACWSWPAPASCTFPDDETATAFLVWWNRECAICASRHALVTDHDHRTGLIRGRLCPSCNASEGRSDQALFRKYRDRNPASILGISVRYWSSFSGYAEPQPPPCAAEQNSMRAAVDRLTLPSPEDLALSIGH